MANPNKKNRDNLPGKFYVDEACIACDACVCEAPKFFVMNDELGHAYVFRQPKTEDEIELCEEAMDLCPVDAIGDNGEA